jgi:MFS transporter, DHA2 family, multidrug resistance protein
MRPEPPYPRRTRWLAVLAVAVMVFMAGLDMTIVAVALPDLSADFVVGPGAAQLAVLAYLLPVIVLMLPAGRWVDRTDRRRAFLLVVTGFGLSSALVSAASSLPTVLTARALQGIFAAAVGALSFAVIATAVRPEDRGKAQGLIAMLGPLGSVAGPGLGGMVVAGYGWRAVFLVNVPICLLGGWLGVRALVRPAEPAASAGPKASWLHEFGTLLRGRAVAAALLVLLAGTTVTGSYNALLPFLLQDSWAQSPRVVGAMLLALPATMAVTSLAGGWLADRVGPSRVQLAGAAVLVLGTYMLLTAVTGAAVHAELLPVLSALMVTGLASGLLMGPNAALLMAATPEQRAGSVGAMAGLVRAAGFALGPALAAVVWQSVGGDLAWIVAGLTVVLVVAVAALAAATMSMRDEHAGRLVASLRPSCQAASAATAFITLW